MEQPCDSILKLATDHNVCLKKKDYQLDQTTKTSIHITEPLTNKFANEKHLDQTIINKVQSDQNQITYTNNETQANSNEIKCDQKKEQLKSVEKHRSTENFKETIESAQKILGASKEFYKLSKVWWPVLSVEISV